MQLGHFTKKYSSLLNKKNKPTTKNIAFFHTITLIISIIAAIKYKTKTYLVLNSMYLFCKFINVFNLKLVCTIYLHSHDLLLSLEKDSFTPKLTGAAKLPDINPNRSPFASFLTIDKAAPPIDVAKPLASADA